MSYAPDSFNIMNTTQETKHIYQKFFHNSSFSDGLVAIGDIENGGRSLVREYGRILLCWRLYALQFKNQHDT